MPIVQVKNKIYEPVFGDKVTLDCDIISDPLLSNVYWIKEENGKQIIINQRSIGYQSLTPGYPSLTITYATIYDNGNYTCLGTNEVGTSRSEQIFLHVIGGKYCVNFNQKISLFIIIIRKANPCTYVNFCKGGLFVVKSFTIPCLFADMLAFAIKH